METRVRAPAGDAKLAKQGEGGRRVRACDNMAAAILAVLLPEPAEEHRAPARPIAGWLREKDR